eukprot:NODE_95_length_21460_cov_0.300220.p5 type:complete len:423 gc:universal NODE_95_length_21460_cov_0.300220:18535-17267(-)
MPHESLNTHGLPFLPGNQINLNQSQDFKKKHHCDVKLGSRTVDIVNQEAKSKIQSIFKTAQLDKMICHFIAQDVSSGELCTISYFLEDETIKVVMKKTAILDRVTAMKNRDDHLEIFEMQLGTIVKVYGKAYKLLQMEDHGRAYLKKHGYDLGMNLRIPLTEKITQKTNYEVVKSFPLKQFIEYDKQVLRFFGLWDDSKNMFGEKHYLVVLYYLTDNSIEVHECAQGDRNHSKSFLNRSKLTHPSGKYFQPSEFEIGKFVTIYCREILIYDCDEFTSKFFISKLSIEMIPISISAEAVETSESVNHEYQASLFYHNRKYEADVLKFSAYSDHVGYEDRKFALTFYPFDNTFALYEIKQPNTGIPGGLFMKRSKAHLSDGTPLTCTAVGSGKQVKLVGLIFTIGEGDKFSQAFILENYEEFEE